MKGPSKVENPIINKVDRHTIWAINFLVKLMQRVKFRIQGFIPYLEGRVGRK